VIYLENLNDREGICKGLIDKLQENKIKYDAKKLRFAFEYASKIYGDTKRYKGETTFVHAVHVAEIVATLKIGIEAVYASILHEVTKFKEYKYEEIEQVLGEEVATLVKDASKLYLLNYNGQQEIEAENLRKMFMAISKDIRVVIMKLADRLYNMRNIYEEPMEHQILKANETMQVYVPIAHRLGMNQIKSELEDISFAILNPEEFENIRVIVDKDKEERQAYINQRIEEIKKLLEKEKIKATIYGRSKTFYSIYKKTKKNNCGVEDLFDLYAIRVIVNSIRACYTVLGIIHENYKPMPGRMKDYIAVPKTNMYQSLHTTLFGGDDAAPFEVQIRTWDMHNVADYGVAAHFLYKEGKTKMSASDEKLTWLRKTMEFERELGETGDFSDLKVELFGDEVFVFTPKGEIKSLPKGATPIDFAYHVHQHVGNSMIGAKINGKMVPITTKLKNTDIVEIITSKTSSGPKRDWLNHVTTSTAKNRIVNYLKKQNREINIEKGREILEREIIKNGLNVDEILDEQYMNAVAQKLKFKDRDECFENIGFGILSPRKLLNKLQEEYNIKNNIHKDETKEIKDIKETKKLNKDQIDGVEVEGIGNCLVKFARCCNPLPGDEIVGYITFGKGVSIHRASCPNLVSLNVNERRIGVKWKEKANVTYQAAVIVKANDRTGISMEVLKLLQDMKVKLHGFTAKDTEDKTCVIDIKLEISSVDELQKIIKSLRKIDSVYDVRRAK